MSDPLDLLTLRLVIAIADSGSISAGSERLQMSVAAGSARVSALETALGIRVFERSSRGVALTPAGQLLVQRGGTLVEDASRLAADLRDWGQGLAGTVRLLANASAIHEVLPARLERFMRDHPRILVQVDERMSPQIVGDLLERRADVGVVDSATPTQGLAFVPFFRDELALVVPRGHALSSRGPVTLAQVLDEAFVVLEGANAVTRRLFNAALELGRPVKVRMQMRSFDAACRMVAAGLGVAVLPSQALGPQLAHLAVAAVGIDEPWVRRTHYLALRDGDAPPAAQLLVDALVRD